MQHCRVFDATVHCCAERHLSIELLRQEILCQLLCRIQRPFHLHRGGHVALPRPAQCVQWTHHWAKHILNPANGDAVLRAQHSALCQCPPIFCYLDHANVYTLFLMESLHSSISSILLSKASNGSPKSINQHHSGLIDFSRLANIQ